MSNLVTILKQEISTAKAYINDIAKDMNVGHRKFCQWELEKLSRASSTVTIFNKFLHNLQDVQSDDAQWARARAGLTIEMMGFPFEDGSSTSGRMSSQSDYNALCYLKHIIDIKGKGSNPYWSVDMSRVDWAMLRAQKGVITELAEDNRLDDEEKSALTGLIHLLDSIQDTVALTVGEKQIFGDQE